MKTLNVTTLYVVNVPLLYKMMCWNILEISQNVFFSVLHFVTFYKMWCLCSVLFTFCDHYCFVTFYLIWHLHFRTVTFRSAAFWPWYITWSWRFVTFTLCAATFCSNTTPILKLNPPPPHILTVMAPFHANQSIATIWIELASLFELEFKEHDPDYDRRAPMYGREGGDKREIERLREWGQTDFLVIYFFISFCYIYMTLYWDWNIIWRASPFFFSHSNCSLKNPPKGARPRFKPWTFLVRWKSNPP